MDSRTASLLIACSVLSTTLAEAIGVAAIIDLANIVAFCPSGQSYARTPWRGKRGGTGPGGGDLRQLRVRLSFPGAPARLTWEDPMPWRGSYGG
jgi:hypothetical protein